MISGIIPRILIIEDNPVDFRILKYAFCNTGIVVELDEADDGESAMTFLRKETNAGARPALILLDLNLPKMSGMEVLRNIKAHDDLRCIPVIVLSSSQFQSDVSRAYEAGASLYVHKPNDLDKLEELVNAIATAWLKYGMLPDACGSVGSQDAQMK